MASTLYNRSVQFVADRYGISDPRVRTLFRNGEIACIDISDSGSGRAVYRTSDAALLDWERRRAVAAAHADAAAAADAESDWRDTDTISDASDVSDVSEAVR